MQGIDLGKVALVLAAVKIWDAVNDPIFGYIFDKVKFKSGLKGLPWVRISVIGIPFVTIAVFAIPQASETVKLVWFAVAYLLWDTVYTLTDVALNGLWIVYALGPVIGMIISTFFYLGYKLNDKDVQIMAKCNAGEISREEAEARLRRKY